MRIAPIGLALALLSSTASADDFLVEPPRPTKPSMKPALIATGVTALTFGLLGYSYSRYRGALEFKGDILWSDPQAWDKHIEAHHDVSAWRDRTVGCAVLAVVSVGVTGYFWSSRERSPTVNVTPMSGGMRVSLARAF